MATSAFGKAFKEARAAGDKTFTFNGKKYTTQLASEAEQPSVGGKAKPGEYKTRAPFSDRGREMMEREYKTRAPFSDRGRDMMEQNYVRRDMADVDARLDRETAGLKTEMAYKPRRTETEEATSEGFKKGGKVGSASRRADGIAMRGKTRGRLV